MGNRKIKLSDLEIDKLYSSGINALEDFDIISFALYAKRIQRDIIARGDDIYRYPNGDIYLGEWKDNLMNGRGIYSSVRGEVYVGEWLDNLRHGNGIGKFENGNIYVGEFKNGLRNGKGILICSDGIIYAGRWKYDVNNSSYYFFDGKKSYILKV